MPSLKLDVRSSVSGSPDLVSFFLKGSALLCRRYRPRNSMAHRRSTRPAARQNQRTLVAGVGEKAKIEPDKLRKAAGTAIKALLKLGASDIALDLSTFSEHTGPAVEGAILASYKFNGFGKDPSKNKRGVLTRLQVIVKDGDIATARAAAREAEIVATTSNTIRGIGNLPGNLLTPAILAEKAQDLASGRALSVKVWNERHLARDGFGGILAVGQGSANPPRLIVIEYRGGGKKEAPVALVGKAVTFDTGGISLKPGAAMDEMKWDKMGGLAVLGMMLAAADLKLPRNIIGLIPAAENMPGPDAYRPGDIITSRDGKTIENQLFRRGRAHHSQRRHRARARSPTSRRPSLNTPRSRARSSSRWDIVAQACSPPRKSCATRSSSQASRRANRSGPCRSTTSTGRASSPKSPRPRTRATAKAARAARPASSRCGPRKRRSSTSTSPASPGIPSRPRISKAARPASACASPFAALKAGFASALNHLESLYF